MRKLRVLVTRPDPGGKALCQLIQQQDEAIYFPTIAFAGPPDLDIFLEQVMQIGNQNWLIFISPRSVIASVPAIRQAWPQLPSSVKFAAIGRGTAHVLKEAGYTLALYPPKEWNSEGLLSMPELQSLTNQRVMIVRGVGGREYLEQVLPERGAQVTSLLAYERILPTSDVQPVHQLIQQQQIDVMIGSSFEGVKNLKTLLGEEAWHDLHDIPLVVMSERIKMLARDLGFRRIWAVSASNTAVIEWLEKNREQLCQHP